MDCAHDLTKWIGDIPGRGTWWKLVHDQVLASERRVDNVFLFNVEPGTICGNRHENGDAFGLLAGDDFHMLR